MHGVTNCHKSLIKIKYAVPVSRMAVNNKIKFTYKVEGE